MLFSALTMLTSPNLWLPWATAVLTPPASLLITAGETRMEALGVSKSHSYSCVDVWLNTVSASSHYKLTSYANSAEHNFFFPHCEQINIFPTGNICPLCPQHRADHNLSFSAEQLPPHPPSYNLSCFAFPFDHEWKRAFELVLISKQRFLWSFWMAFSAQFRSPVSLVNLDKLYSSCSSFKATLY